MVEHTAQPRGQPVNPSAPADGVDELDLGFLISHKFLGWVVQIRPDEGESVRTSLRAGRI